MERETRPTWAELHEAEDARKGPAWKAWMRHASEIAALKDYIEQLTKERDELLKTRPPSKG